jgi:hypothetical protein
VIESRPDGAQTGLDIAQTFAVAELRKRHTQELVQARECLDVEVAAITGNASAELRVREQVHQLRKNGTAYVHAAIVDPTTPAAFKSILHSATATL